MRARVAAPLLIACFAVFAGCGGAREEATPAACLGGAKAYLAALADAPGEVKLRGETPVSECLVENQAGGELATMGEAMVEAATRLNAEGRAGPGGPAPVRLGYLLGAARRGAADTEGIHADLLRRLAVAARYSPGGDPLPAAFLAAYRRGFDAGRGGG